MNNAEHIIVASNYLSALVGLLLMQSKYRSYTLVERLSLAILLGALVVNASMHLLDGRSQGYCAEALLSVAIFGRFLTAALWKILKSGKCSVTILGAAIAVVLCGCSSTDRDYHAGYDLTTGRTTAEVRITPGTGKRSLSAGVSGNLDWTSINRDLPKLYRDK